MPDMKCYHLQMTIVLIWKIQMLLPLQIRPLKTLALAVLLGAGTMSAASAATNAELARLLEKLTARVQSLEQANADLQRQLAAGRAAPAAATDPAPAQEGVAQRLLRLERQQSALTQSLGAEPAGENEPAIKARLKAVEAQTQELSGPVGKLKGFEGMTGGLSLTMVAQKSFLPSVADSQLGFRADAFVSLPLEPIGDAQQSVFTQFRLGQGAGLTGLGSYSRPNATAFALQGGLAPGRFGRPAGASLVPGQYSFAGGRLQGHFQADAGGHRWQDGPVCVL